MSLQFGWFTWTSSRADGACETGSGVKCEADASTLVLLGLVGGAAVGITACVIFPPIAPAAAAAGKAVALKAGAAKLLAAAIAA